MQPTPRAVPYGRVSTDAQAGEDRTSLQTQVKACREYVARVGWEIVAEITDDETGYALNRPGLNRARSMAAAGEYDVLVAWTQSRLSRSMDDTNDLFRELSSASVSVATVREGIAEETPIGKHIRQTHALVAELDRDARRAATQAGIHGKVEQGRILGSSPRVIQVWEESAGVLDTDRRDALATEGTEAERQGDKLVEPSNRVTWNDEHGFLYCGPAWDRYEIVIVDPEGHRACPVVFRPRNELKG